MKKYILGVLFVTSSITSYANNLNSQSYTEDGYHTHIPCFRFNLKTSAGVPNKFNYMLSEAKDNKQLLKGTIISDSKESSIIQWCDKDLSHVQKLGNLNFHDAYKLTIDGIKYNGLNVGTTIVITSSTLANSFVNHYDIIRSPYMDDVFYMGGKDVHVGETIDIRYNDILKLDNPKFEHTQFGTRFKYDSRYSECVTQGNVANPSCGDKMTYISSDPQSFWGVSLFRKTWLIADIVIPTSISNYHSINNRNLKLSDEAKDFDYAYNLYDKDDHDTDDLIKTNMYYGDPQTWKLHNLGKNLTTYFAGFCSGIGVIDGVVYAACRHERNTSDISNTYPKFVIQQTPTYISYKTACNQDKSILGQTSSLLINDDNGSLRCISYKSDFPHGEYLNSCPGINYDPTNRTLTTDCYDNNKKLVNHVIELGVMGTQTPHYKNVNGSLVAY